MRDSLKSFREFIRNVINFRIFEKSILKWPNLHSDVVTVRHHDNVGSNVCINVDFMFFEIFLGIEISGAPEYSTRGGKKRALTI